MKTEKTFKLTGFVIGNLWGGGLGSYPTIKLNADTREALIEQANKNLSSGNLDSGGGFESLKGALLNIETVSNIKFEGKIFINSEFEEVFIGNLNEKQEDHLIECSIYN